MSATKRVRTEFAPITEPVYSHPNTLFSKTVTFENRTDEEIVVLDRNNIPTVCSVNPNRYKVEQCFVVKTTYTFFGKEMIVSTLLKLQEFAKRFTVIDDNHKVIRTVIENAYAANPNSTIHYLSFEKKIYLDDLKRYPLIYDEGSDYLICTGKGWLTSPHPYSLEGQSIVDHQTYTSGKKVSGCLIELVDNENKIGARYVHCAKQIIKLTPTVNTERQSGVYFTQFTNSEHEADKVEPSFMDFDAAEAELGLHKTEEEALTGGAPEHLSKAAELQAKAALEKLKHEAEAFKHQSKLKEAQVEAELETLRKANAKLKEDALADQILRDKRISELKEEMEARSEKRKEASEVRKDYFEDRSYVRKDSSELVKYVPTILVAAIGIFAYVRK